jgi:hypothetical protein
VNLKGTEHRNKNSYVITEEKNLGWTSAEEGLFKGTIEVAGHYCL